MTRRLAEADINILLIRNFPFDPDVRQGSHTLMVPLLVKSNNRTRGQFECDVT